MMFEGKVEKLWCGRVGSRETMMWEGECKTLWCAAENVKKLCEGGNVVKLYNVGGGSRKTMMLGGKYKNFIRSGEKIENYRIICWILIYSIKLTFYSLLECMHRCCFQLYYLIHREHVTNESTTKRRTFFVVL